MAAEASGIPSFWAAQPSLYSWKAVKVSRNAWVLLFADLGADFQFVSEKSKWKVRLTIIKETGDLNIPYPKMNEFVTNPQVERNDRHTYLNALVAWLKMGCTWYTSFASAWPRPRCSRRIWPDSRGARSSDSSWTCRADHRGFAGAGGSRGKPRGLRSNWSPLMPGPGKSGNFEICRFLRIKAWAVIILILIQVQQSWIL